MPRKPTWDDVRRDDKGRFAPRNDESTATLISLFVGAAGAIVSLLFGKNKSK